MAKYVCLVCGYVYDEAKGIPEAGIKAGTKWEELDADWVCPLCGATKQEFSLQGEPQEVVTTSGAAKIELSHEMKELTPLEMSALCSNLARGCEKQYKASESLLFTQLADFYKQGAPVHSDPSFEKLIELVDTDLNDTFPLVNDIAKADKDRGALRALVWSEKVTKILKSLLARYQKVGNAMIDKTGVYVCTICGFIYVGDTLPLLCPVCKVPNWKFEKIEEVVS